MTTAVPRAPTSSGSGTSRTATRGSFAVTASRAAAGRAEYPAHAHTTPGFGASFKRTVRDKHPMPISISGFGEVLARRENQVVTRSVVKDAWGIPVLRFDYRFGDNELKMAADMADTAEEMLRAAGAEEFR